MRIEAWSTEMLRQIVHVKGSIGQHYWNIELKE